MTAKKIKIKLFNRIFWGLFIFPFMIFILVIILAANGFMGYMPPVEELENPKINLATLIYSEDGKVLGSIYYKNQNRTSVSYEELPDHLVNALIATEDIRFYDHSGVDFKGLVRALAYFGKKGGASTITQQLAKQLFHAPPASIVGRLKQKTKEWIIAIQLEKAYTKEEIITLYFNQFDFLYNAVGVETACKVYFNTTLDSLKIEEAAVLVGMAKNPYTFNPLIFPEKSLKRRNTVLNQMKKYNFISSKKCDSLKALKLTTDFQRVTHNVGLATYFRTFIARTMTRKEPVQGDYANYEAYQEDSIKWASDLLYGWCNKNKKPNGDPYDIYTDGLRIYTTINSSMQQYAEDAVAIHLGGYLQNEFLKEQKGRKYAPFSNDLTRRQRENIIRQAMRNSDRARYLRKQNKSWDEIYKEFEKPVEMRIFTWQGEKDTVMTPLDSILYYKHYLHAGVMSMDPVTGYVKAYVGGINFEHFKYDHVTQGKRQAGSTFKPFLYILAMDEGYSPCYTVPVVPTSFYDNDTVWTPRTTCREEYLGTMQTLKWGLAQSENYVSAWLVNRFKPKPIADIAHKMGINSYIDPVNSIIYGPSDMRVSEMVGAYATMGNKGVHTKPLFVTRIEDKNGNVLATFIPERKESISEKTAYLMLNLMQGVTEYGTAARLRYKYEFTAEIAGKTGTTNKNSDGWFIGITPQLVTGIWVGAEDRSVHFRTTRMGSGTNMALPIWAEYMKKVYEDTELGITQEDTFDAPLGFDVNLNCKEELEENYNDGIDFGSGDFDTF